LAICAVLGAVSNEIPNAARPGAPCPAGDETAEDGWVQSTSLSAWLLAPVNILRYDAMK
jgi:hypothetical protein